MAGPRDQAARVLRPGPDAPERELVPSTAAPVAPAEGYRPRGSEEAARRTAEVPAIDKPIVAAPVAAPEPATPPKSGKRKGILMAVGVVASGLIADRLGRRTTLGSCAILIAILSAFVPTLMNGGELGQNIFILLGFSLLGLSYGQAAGAVTANFPSKYRYTGAALTSDLSWLVGAGFAPLVALGLSAHFGLAYVSFYLLSGAACSLAALSLNRALEIRD